MKNNIKFQIKYLLLCLVLTSCSTLAPKSESNSDESKNKNPLVLSSSCKEEVGREPASSLACQNLLESNNFDYNKESITKKKPIYRNTRSFTERVVFIPIPAGKYITGEPGQEVEITISKPYKMMANVFTQKLYFKLQRYLGKQENNPSQFVGEDKPLERISANEADEIVASLTKLSQSENPMDQDFMQQLIPEHRKGRIYELPTEAQLELAYKLAKTIEGVTVDDMIRANDIHRLKRFVIFSSPFGTDVINIKKPLYIDGVPIYLQGNVYDITKDRWNARNNLSGGVDPVGTSGSYRVIRGGGWGDSAQYLLSSYRGHINPESRYDYVGFRIVTTDP